MNRRMNKCKRFLAVLLLVVMCCTLIPQQVNAEEDYRAWDQADERWGSLELGTSGKTVEDSGCLVTSVTKLIIQAGLKNVEDFNPATLVKWLNKNGGFSGASLVWSKVGEYAGDFTWYYNNDNRLLSSGTYSSAEYNDEIIDWIKEGFHIVLQVKGGGHWVAVDEAMSLATGEVYIMDSQPYNQNADIRLVDRYSNFNRAEAYTGGTTPEVGTDETPDEEEPDVETPDDNPEELPDDFPEEEPDTDPIFVDVEEGAYYTEAVLWAYEEGITTGTDKNHFSPDNSCTRAEIVTFLWRAEGKPAVEGENPFKDVEEGQYYTEAVLWAVQKGITTGVDESHFDPDAICTREQIVTFLWRADGKPSVENENPFEDVEEDAYYTKAVLWAVDKRITTGVDASHFNPKGICSRGQAVTFLYRQYGKTGTIII